MGDPSESRAGEFEHGASNGEFEQDASNGEFERDVSNGEFGRGVSNGEFGRGEIEQVERELVLPAPPDRVWDVVTSSGWLAEEVDLELAPGGAARFASLGSVREGWVEEAAAPGLEQVGRLTFWWCADDEPATRVELTLEPEGHGHTRLRVVEARPLELLDVVGIPLPGSGGSARGPAMLAAV